MAEPLPARESGQISGRTGALPSGVAGTLIFLTLGLVVAALYFAREVLVPFALAVLLSFLLAPAVRWPRHLRAGRVGAVAITVVVSFQIIFAFGLVVGKEMSLLGPELPRYERNIETKLRSLPQAIPLDRVAAALHQVTLALKRSEKPSPAPAVSSPGAGQPNAEPASPLPVVVQQPEPTPLEIAETVIGPLLQPLATAGLVVVLVIFMLLEREELRDRLLKLVGSGDLHRTTEAMDEAAHRVSRYLLSQLAINAVEGMLIGTGLAVIGIPNAALWGILAMLLRFIPYLGIVIAACFPLALAIAVAPGWSLLVWTALLFVATELIVANLVEPRLYAGSTGLSSVAVIIAAVFWTWLWGPIGLLLSTPLTACLLVLGRHVPQLRFFDVMLGSEPVLTPDEMLYQRLLADDPEEATEQAEEFINDKSLGEFADEVAIPMLARAQADSDSGLLPAERRTIVKKGFANLLENLFEDSAIDPDAAADSGESGSPDRGFVACVSGRNELDEAAAMLLASLLRARGRAADVFAADSPAALGNSRVSLRDAAIVCLSLISTSSPARARHIVRRLRRRAPRAPILAGFWGVGAAGAAPSDELAVSAADAVATTLGEAIAEVEKRGAAAPRPIAATEELPPTPEEPRLQAQAG
ncbi:MAG TPA: AI-2E family transporter [Stellaceae bacterium]|jgi:predicted PurR-regulated permease PerM